jgi:hypothetical protein
MDLRIHTADANLRATPSTAQSPLSRLPAGHLIVTTGAAQGSWQPCQTTVGGHALNGFVHTSLLRPQINPEVDRLVELAGAEYRDFLFGTRHETHPDSKPRIKAYWLSFQSTAEPVSVAWSAAFISFVVKKAQLAKSFKFSGRHTTYLSDSKRAFTANPQDASRAYWAVRLSDRKLEIGDMVGYYRTGGDCGSAVRTYDSLPGDFCSHCDLVVAIRGNTAITIGGNVSNTVKVTEVPLDANGHVQTGSKRIVVMKRNF